MQTWLRSCVAVALAKARAVAPIRSLAWEPPYAIGAALKKKKKKKKKKGKSRAAWDPVSGTCWLPKTL